jgi:hypothetical protein
MKNKDVGHKESEFVATSVAALKEVELKLLNPTVSRGLS